MLANLIYSQTHRQVLKHTRNYLIKKSVGEFLGANYV